MVSTIEFSYLNTVFSLNIDESVLNRAVRVKTVVKDKIKRVFDNNVDVKNTNISSVNTADVVHSEDKSLLDLSEETLNAIAEKLLNMQKQVNIPFVSNRAVLFTGALVSKIRLVTDKWYSSRISLETGNGSLTNEYSGVNITGGEVIPGTWDSLTENIEQEVNTVNAVPAQEFVQPNVDVNEQSSFEVKTTDDELPNFEIEKTYEPEVENYTIQPPVVEYDTNENEDVYSFVPNMDDFTVNVVPTVSIPKQSVDFDNSETVPEPHDLNNVSENDFVNEPVSIPSFETSVVDDEIEKTISTSVELEQPKEEKNNTKTNLISIEDKIAQLLQRKSNGSASEYSVSSDTSVEKTNSTFKEKNEFTQTHIMARLRRVLNEMSEKDEAIKKLSSKNKAIADEMSQAKDKIRGYEAVVSDLTARNDSLVKDNERLSAKVQEVQASSQASISKLESQVEELSKSRNEESESSKTTILELKTRHAEEIADLKEKHANELRSVNESKDRQIQAIYATISEVLGDSSIDDNYGKSIAA